jgi:hypothetical protein
VRDSRASRKVHVVGLTTAGRHIDNALEIWQSYANRHQTLHGCDLTGTGEPTILTKTEVVRTRIIASRISNDECARLLRRTADAPWRCLSADADLADADPIQRGGVFDKAASLYWHFTTPHEPG